MSAPEDPLRPIEPDEPLVESLNRVLAAARESRDVLGRLAVLERQSVDLTPINRLRNLEILLERLQADFATLQANPLYIINRPDPPETWEQATRDMREAAAADSEVLDRALGIGPEPIPPSQFLAEATRAAAERAADTKEECLQDCIEQLFVLADLVNPKAARSTMDRIRDLTTNSPVYDYTTVEKKTHADPTCAECGVSVASRWQLRLHALECPRHRPYPEGTPA